MPSLNKQVEVILFAYGQGMKWALDDGETISDCPIESTVTQWKTELKNKERRERDEMLAKTGKIPVKSLLVHECYIVMSDGSREYVDISTL